MKHPCFDKNAAGRFARVHLPVAPRCNIQCAYCDRRFSCVNESRPGVAARVVSPEEACGLVLAALEKMPALSVAGIAGPGDPLANPEETLETFRLLRAEAPGLLLCLSTNGLALPQYAADLAALGLRHLTVTINAVDPAIGARIYLVVKDGGRLLEGEDGAALLLERQLDGLGRARELGIRVKVNMVIVPGINDFHVAEAARRLAAFGVDLLNCIPMSPVPGTPLGALAEPGCALMAKIREEAGKWLPQMSHCSRCRADALGFLGGSGILEDMRPKAEAKA